MSGIAARSDVYLLTAASVIHIDLKTYQQVILYLVPLLGQLQFINIMVVLVRLYWFERKFKDVGMPPLSPASPAVHMGMVIY